MTQGSGLEEGGKGDVNWPWPRSPPGGSRKKRPLRAPGEKTIRRLAEELGENPDVLLALAGKVSSDLLAIIRERPTVVAELLRALRGLSAKRVSAISRQIRDGDW